MKKVISLALAGLMVMSLAACGEKNEPVKEEPNVSITDTETTIEKEDVVVEEELTVAETLLESFSDKAKEATDALSLAKELVSNEIIAFNGDAIPVEPGLLNGFGETEITGFKEGAMFAPMIGTIPFVGYVFVLEDDADVNAFEELLLTSSDLRWNVCTEADEKVVSSVDNKVFFVMSPLSFEQEMPTEDMPVEEMPVADEVVENTVSVE